MSDRFKITQDRSGKWRVTDSKTGRLHSAAIASKGRAQRQADAMNKKFATPNEEAAHELLQCAILMSLQPGGRDRAQRAAHLARGLRCGITIEEVQERINKGELR